MSKNPFEIRADILQMTKEYMDKIQETNISYAEKLYELGQIQFEEYQKMTESYSVEELTKKATEMYSFVSNKE